MTSTTTPPVLGPFSDFVCTGLKERGIALVFGVSFR